MRCREILLCTIVLAMCFPISLICGQDWLDGGYVGRSYSSDIAQYFTDPIFYPPSTGTQYQNWEQMYYPYFGAEFFRDYAQPYKFKPGTYPGPYGVYPFNPLPYYSDFRLNSLAGMKWEPFQKNWSETMEYAKTKSSLRTYPRSSFLYPPFQPNALTTVDTRLQ